MVEDLVDIPADPSVDFDAEARQRAGNRHQSPGDTSEPSTGNRRLASGEMSEASADFDLEYRTSVRRDATGMRRETSVDGGRTDRVDGTRREGQTGGLSRENGSQASMDGVLREGSFVEAGSYHRSS